MNLHLLLLARCQGFFLTHNITFIAINGLVWDSAWHPALQCGVRPGAVDARFRPVASAGASLTSFSSGAWVTTRGWAWQNVGSLMNVSATGLAPLWLAARRRSPSPKSP